MKFRGGVQSTPEGNLGTVYTSHKQKTVVATLDTSGAATTIANAFPAFSRLKACAAQVTTAIAGADATAFTLEIAGKTVATGADLTVYPAQGGMIAWNVGTTAAMVATTGSAGDVVITLTGGSDQTPTAGVITLDMVFEEFRS